MQNQHQNQEAIDRRLWRCEETFMQSILSKVGDSIVIAMGLTPYRWNFSVMTRVIHLHHESVSKALELH
jgi:hypothetical protein